MNDAKWCYRVRTKVAKHLLASIGGIVDEATGRRFFHDADLERRFLDRVQAAISAAGVWDEFQTTWVCLDCELMPWSAKAQELLRSQYAATGAAGRASLPTAVALLKARHRG